MDKCDVAKYWRVAAELNNMFMYVSASFELAGKSGPTEKLSYGSTDPELMPTTGGLWRRWPLAPYPTRPNSIQEGEYDDTQQATPECSTSM